MSPAAVSRGKIVGVALLVVAAAALVVGIVMATTGGQEAPVAAGEQHPAGGAGSSAPPAASGTAGSGTASATPPSVSSSNSPTTTAESGATTTIVPPPPANPRPHNGNEGETAQQAGSTFDKGASIRVYNNSTIRGLASRAAQDFRDHGYTVVEVGNYSRGIIPKTTAYYRPGTDEQGTAESLGKQFGMRVKPRFPGIHDASPGVIVILTMNYDG